ncbi:RNA methyltransferase [Deinococcus cavernae]|uniref:RNA methyltransferase n=1 Tax=Deinococcus cavernae TaxID=2320857 RepID=UPI0011C21130|nr:RNA methyltransferase [Deinococcus cavernae]
MHPPERSSREIADLINTAFLFGCEDSGTTKDEERSALAEYWLGVEFVEPCPE